MSPFFPLLFFAAFIAIFILPGVLRRQAENRHNAAQPLVEREAFVVSRRQQVRGHKATRTYYFVTFQFRDGSREELEMEGPQYGLLAEGDTGVLHTQGTWFKGFARAPHA
jgi:hypothetical protein